MKTQIVNREDEIIGYKERDQRTSEDIFRITHIWIFNQKGEFLIAKRQPTKKVSPDKWSQAVGGTLEDKDTYESNARQELEEEIGVKGVELIPFKKIYYENSNGKRFCHIFIAKIDKDVKDFFLQKEEVAEVKWISIADLSLWYQKTPEDFIPSMGQTIDLVKEYNNRNAN